MITEKEIDAKTGLKILEVLCPLCSKTTILMVDPWKYKLWKLGKLAQVAFPEMSAQERDVLITGLCKKCWNELY